MRGVVALAVVSLIVGLSGNARWSRNIDARMQALAAATPQTHSQRYDDEELKNLPPVVRRYLSLALNPNQPIVRGLYLEQTGSFNRSSDPQTPQWEPFTARQRVATKRPGFVWDAAITVSPGITVRVVDAYVAGVGSLQPSVLGLVDVGSSEGNTDIARGELIRYFAESVWYPTALLPSQGVQWEAVDAHSAKATLTDGPLTVSLLFAFDAVGFVERISSTERSALLNGAMVPMPWEVRLFNYAEHDGMRVPQGGSGLADTQRSLALLARHDRQAGLRHAALDRAGPVHGYLDANRGDCCADTFVPISFRQSFLSLQFGKALQRNVAVVWLAWACRRNSPACTAPLTTE